MVRLGVFNLIFELNHLATGAKLFWSAESKRVAAYAGWKRGGATRIFVRDGGGFAEVKVPQLPDLPDEVSAKVLKKHPGGFPQAITIGDLTGGDCGPVPTSTPR